MIHYLLAYAPPMAVLFMLITGRLVPRYARPDLPERPLGLVERLRFQLHRQEIVDDLTDLRHELER